VGVTLVDIYPVGSIPVHLLGVVEVANHVVAVGDDLRRVLFGPVDARPAREIWIPMTASSSLTASPLRDLDALGRSGWFDNMRRALMRSGACGYVEWAAGSAAKRSTS